MLFLLLLLLLSNAVLLREEPIRNKRVGLSAPFTPRCCCCIAFGSVPSLYSSSSLIQDDIDRVLLPEGMVRDRIEKMVKECRMRLKHTHTIT